LTYYILIVNVSVLQDILHISFAACMLMQDIILYKLIIVILQVFYDMS